MLWRLRPTDADIELNAYSRWRPRMKCQILVYFTMFHQVEGRQEETHIVLDCTFCDYNMFLELESNHIKPIESTGISCGLTASYAISKGEAIRIACLAPLVTVLSKVKCANNSSRKQTLPAGLRMVACLLAPMQSGSQSTSGLQKPASILA